MTAQEALAQAQQRWGPDAAICNEEIDGRIFRLVGVLTRDNFAIRGRGATWEDAFKNAQQSDPPPEMMPLG